MWLVGAKCEPVLEFAIDFGSLLCTIAGMQFVHVQEEGIRTPIYRVAVAFCL